MEKLKEYWQERSSRQRMAMVGAFIATFVAVAGFALLASRQPMALLYGGLDASQAGTIIAEMDRQRISYQIRGESIWVPAGDRDRLRLDLAAQGLPEAGAAGYELLDGLSGFGTTSQMFDAAYWRAKEGELARTILASPNVKSARVHLAVPTSRGYRRDAAGAASVTITTAGNDILREQALALRYLVASAVPGMAPESVTVIDSRRGVVDTDSHTAGDRQQRMKRDIENILTAHVGSGNAVVELSLEIETRSEQLSERRFDPSERALIAQEIEESSDQSQEGPTGAVTAASNLPDSNSQGDGQSTANRESTRQRSNFEVSETRRDVIAAPGDVRRLTVAVLVNGIVETGADGKPVIVPRSDAELASLAELVSSAVGIDESRGDQLTIKSLPFAELGDGGTTASRPGLIERLALNNLARLLLVGIFAIVAIRLLLRPVLAARSASQAAITADPAPQPLARTDMAPPPTQQAIAPPDAMANPRGEPEMSVLPPQPSEATPNHGGSKSSDPVQRLRNLMRERQDESIHVLSNWITDKEAKT